MLKNAKPRLIHLLSANDSVERTPFRIPRVLRQVSASRSFLNELLKVSGGKFFCAACQEELGLKRSTIHNHVRSQKHENNKKKLEMKTAWEQDIAEALVSIIGIIQSIIGLTLEH